MNYVAKAKGVKRGMTVYEALCVCPDVITVHVSTIEVKEKTDSGPRKMQRFWCDIDPQKDKGEGGINDTFTDQKQQSEPIEKTNEDSEEDEDCVLIPSSISKTKILSTDESLEPYRRFWVEMRQK